MFITALSLCTYAACNTYVVDTALTISDCQTNLELQADRMASVWNDHKSLTEYLESFNISESNTGISSTSIQEYNFVCVEEN